jgi:hypothetical protein
MWSVARDWLSIRVDLIGGRGEYLWPRPGREFAAARSHSFAQLADAINTAFARWDRAHLYQFVTADGRVIGQPEFDDFGDEMVDAANAKLGTLALGERFAFEFDLGDGWTHLCTVGDERIDPLDALGITPREPLPFFGWGAIPDQYGRESSDGDAGEDPELRDLPPLIQW